MAGIEATRDKIGGKAVSLKYSNACLAAIYLLSALGELGRRKLGDERFRKVTL